jgi:hypothetical protein
MGGDWVDCRTHEAIDKVKESNDRVWEGFKEDLHNNVFSEIEYKWVSNNREDCSGIGFNSLMPVQLKNDMSRILNKFCVNMDDKYKRDFGKLHEIEEIVYKHDYSWSNTDVKEKAHGLYCEFLEEFKSLGDCYKLLKDELTDAKIKDIASNLMTSEKEKYEENVEKYYSERFEGNVSQYKQLFEQAARLLKGIVLCRINDFCTPEMKAVKYKLEEDIESL